MPTPKFQVGDVVFFPDSKQVWVQDPPGTRYKVVFVEDRVELLGMPRQDPHRYDKLHLSLLDGSEPNLLHGPTVFALWCQLDPFLTAASHAILEGDSDEQDNKTIIPTS